MCTLCYPARARETLTNIARLRPICHSAFDSIAYGTQKRYIFRVALAG